MNVTDHYRSTLDELTRDRPGGPDLSAAIAGGRRRRRARRTAWVGAGVAAAAVVACSGVALTHHSSSVAVDSGLGGNSTYPDFVAGTDLDETIQATVAAHLPQLPPPTQLYPTDWNHPDPIPDADFADATEWHAVYQVSDTEQVRLVMSQRIPGETMTPGTCDDVQQVGLPCQRTEGADGSLDMRFGTVIGSSTYRFLTLHVTPGRFLVETLDDVQAHSWAEAEDARGLTDAGTSALVRDPALRFPAPVHTPPPPGPQM